MIDPFGRHISYLRVSVTDRCDFRCVYCMAEDMTFLPKAEVLSLGHAVDAAEVAAIRHGDAEVGDVAAERVDHGSSVTVTPG